MRSDAERVARQLRRESRVASAEAVEAAVALLPPDPEREMCSARGCPFEAVDTIRLYPPSGNGVGVGYRKGEPRVCAIHRRLAAYHPWHRSQFGLPPRAQDVVETPLAIPARFTPVPGDRPATMRRVL